MSYLRAFGDFEGGKLWVEDPAGQTEVRHQDRMLMGTLYPTKGHWLKLNAKHLVHSVEKEFLSVCTLQELESLSRMR